MAASPPPPPNISWTVFAARPHTIYVYLRYFVRFFRHMRYCVLCAAGKIDPLRLFEDKYLYDKHGHDLHIYVTDQMVLGSCTIPYEAGEPLMIIVA